MSETLSEKAEVKITDFNRDMTKEEREYYGEYYDETR